MGEFPRVTAKCRINDNTRGEGRSMVVSETHATTAGELEALWRLDPDRIYLG
jgi:hypothetical protein